MKKEYWIIIIASLVIGIVAYFLITRTKGVAAGILQKDPVKAASNNSTCNFPISEGNTIPCHLVMNLQRYLNTFPTVGDILVVDGIWGPKTTDTMKARGVASPSGPLNMADYISFTHRASLK